jgi:hypothetical protein
MPVFFDRFLDPLQELLIRIDVVGLQAPFHVLTGSGNGPHQQSGWKSDTFTASQEIRNRKLVL